MLCYLIIIVTELGINIQLKFFYLIIQQMYTDIRGKRALALLILGIGAQAANIKNSIANNKSLDINNFCCIPNLHKSSNFLV